MATKSLPHQDVLLQMLEYDPDTGFLTWRSRSAEGLSGHALRGVTAFNSGQAGKPALHHIDLQGYRVGHLLRQLVKSHRVIWKMITGSDPDQVDHIDGNRANNVWANLRDVDNSGNQRNARMRSDNTSGVVGVTWYPHERKVGKWLVTIKGKHVGFFDSFVDAVAARKAAEVENGFHENHGRPKAAHSSIAI